ncbi:hypothetical protein vseg_010939 [Gypsophila vaccaria]
MSNAKEMTSKFGKLEKFEGVDFRRWQKKMHFLLTTLKVVYVLSTPIPKVADDGPIEEIRKRNKWENDDYICRGHILNGMSDSLFDVYQNVESAKELWNALESKYMAEDASSKKFFVGNFMNYKMLDSKPVMEQYNELLRILGQFAQHKMEMDESISVSSIIDKLSPSWKDFKHMLKHKKEELYLVQLGGHLRIEESLKAQEGVKGKGKENMESPSVNMMEVGERFKSTKGKGINKKPKGACWICGKTGHFKNDCRLRKTKKGTKKSRSGQGSKDQGPPAHQGCSFARHLWHRRYSSAGRKATAPRPRACTLCRQCVQEEGWDAYVALRRKNHHFISNFKLFIDHVTIESTGAFPPEVLFTEVAKILEEKCVRVITELS